MVFLDKTTCLIYIIMVLSFRKVYFGEHRCFGDGANQKGRVPYSKQLTDSQASHFTSISYIDGDEWLH